MIKIGLPFHWICIMGIIFVGSYGITPGAKIRRRQQLELFIIGFYFIYILEWIFKTKETISFNLEIRYYGSNEDEYLKVRSLYEWEIFL